MVETRSHGLGKTCLCVLGDLCGPAGENADSNTTEARLNPRHKTLLKTVIGLALLIGLVVLVERAIGWAALLAPWRSLQPGPLAAAIILIFTTYGLRALRVHDYFRHETRGRFAAVLRLSLQHNLLNNLLPARSGELSFPVLMARQFAIPAMRSMPALLWFRLLDLHTLLTGALLVTGDALLGPVWTLPLGLAWLLLPWLGHRLFARRLARWSLPADRLGAFLHRLVQALPLEAAPFWRSWLWTLLNWGIKLAVFAWVLELFAPMAFAAAWTGVIAGDLTSVLPVHGVAGAGTYEAGVVAGLLPFGVDARSALQAAVNLHLFVLGCTLLSGLLSLTLPARRRGDNAE